MEIVAGELCGTRSGWRRSCREGQLARLCTIGKASLSITVLGQLVSWVWIVGLAGSVAVGQDLDANRVSQAIERGTDFLRREQNRARGDWSADDSSYVGGVTSLCTLALLNCGVPPQDPQIQQSLHYLRGLDEPKRTYTAALQAMVFSVANLPADHVRVQRLVNWLAANQIRGGASRGGWSYPGPNIADNSNTQFAVLGLYEADRIGIFAPRETWLDCQKYWRDSHRVGEGWGYRAGTPSSGSMTCAGIAGLLIANSMLDPGDAKLQEGQLQCCQPHAEDPALTSSLQWLGGGHFSVQRNPGENSTRNLYYYLYALERVGRLTARRYIGGHDWYREGAKFLINSQALSGEWSGAYHAQITTSFALLFLSKGRRPLLVGKLRHGVDGDWNRHRHDLAHLTRYTEKRWLRDLTWQVIHNDRARVEDLLLAPVLFVSGEDAPRLLDHAEKLRAYLDRGGFLFGVANCGDGQFDAGFRRLIEQIFPEDEYALRKLDPTHSIWRAEEQVTIGDLPDNAWLWGVEYGCRTCVAYCPVDLSCYWELGTDDDLPAEIRRAAQAAYAVGVNVLTYATGRSLSEKPLELRPAASADRSGFDRNVLRIAKLRHLGGCDAAPAALSNLMRAAAEELQGRVETEVELIALTDKELFKYPLVFMHGKHAFRWTADERKLFQRYLERGGMLFVDSICSSRAFTASVRNELQAIFPDRPLERIPIADPLLGDDYGGSNIRSVSRRKPQVSAADGALLSRVSRAEPLLEAIRMGDRYAVVFSPYDVSCALENHESLECEGYVSRDAARIGLNVILYALSQ